MADKNREKNGATHNEREYLDKWLGKCNENNNDVEFLSWRMKMKTTEEEKYKKKDVQRKTERNKLHIMGNCLHFHNNIVVE